MLAADDVAFLRTHRDEVRACLDYVDRLLQEPAL
jgi:hypothetical protein